MYRSPSPTGSPCRSLVLDHLWMVRPAVDRIGARGVCREDLLGAGALGLVQAARRYDSARGSFPAFAWCHIRGAALDEARRILGGRCNRRPPQPVSLDIDVATDDDDRAVSLHDRLAGPDDVERDALAGVLEVSMASLSARQRYVLDAYYWGGRTLLEIGQGLGVTESRACQLHTSAVRHLRAKAVRSLAA